MPPKYDSIPVSSQGKTLGKGDGSETGASNYKSKLFVASLIAICAVVTLLVVPSSTTSLMPTAHPALLSSLSERAQEIKPDRDDLAMFSAGLMDPYHPTENQDGYLLMLVAENKLMYSELAAKVQEVSSSDQPMPQWVFDYGDLGGQADFKASVAKVMQRWIIPHVNPDNLRFQAGAGSILDCLAFCLANPDDGVLVAGPNYPAFTSDFGLKSKVRLHVAGTRASNNYEPTVQELDEAFELSIAAGNPPKILIICQPNNPTGAIYSPESMRLQIKWALEKGLHVVSDEIYALSVFPGEATTSAAQIMSEINIDEEKYLGDRVHVVAGLSKDWGMSGFRVGSLFTHNERLLQTVHVLEYY
jgi:aspartate/methionine/tyrosine aminotransferase